MVNKDPLWSVKPFFLNWTMFAKISTWFKTPGCFSLKLHSSAALSISSAYNSVAMRLLTSSLVLNLPRVSLSLSLVLKASVFHQRY